MGSEHTQNFSCNIGLKEGPLGEQEETRFVLEWLSKDPRTAS